MRVMTIQSDFTGGELDPKLYGRVSIPRYQSGLQTAKNVDIMVTGGATRRAGTKFVYNAGPAASTTVRQIPFVIFRTDTTPASLKGYVVEFRSDNKIRFYVNGALILTGGSTPYEITSPFTSADLSLIKYEQFNSGLYLVHPDFPPQKLTRVSDTSWTIAAMNFTFNTPQAQFGNFFTEQISPKNIQVRSIAWAPGRSLFVAVGDQDLVDALILTSPDGITWTERVNPKAAALVSVCWTGTQFVAVGGIDGADAYILTSPDGITWTERANPKAVILSSVCWTGTQCVAVGFGDGTDSYILTSPNGISWTERAPTVAKNCTLTSVCWSGSLLVAVGYPYYGVTYESDAYILTSPDGITWTERANPKPAILNAVCWSDFLSLFVAVGQAQTWPGPVAEADAYIITSPDGIAWTERANPKAYNLTAVASSDSQVAAVGAEDLTDAYILTSDNGLLWNERANPKRLALSAACWGGSFFVAAGAVGSTYPYIITSMLPVQTEGVTRSGSTVTATTTSPHNLETGQIVTMAGAVQSEYNGTFQVTVLNDYVFTYTIAGTPATPATGTVTFARVPWGTTGYPAAITFFEQRLILARTKQSPQTIWGSETNNLLNFVLGVYDSSPFEFVPSAAAAAVNQLLATTQVLVLTNDKEIVMSGGSGLPLTPSNVQIKAVGRYGSKDGIRPLAVGGEVLFATRGAQRVRAMAYKLVEDSYKFPNIAIMAEHLLDAGILELWQASEPESAVYVLTADGKIARIAYDRDQEVVAFSRYETDGLFRGMAVVQEGLTDQIYVTVQRVINGTAQLYTELFDPALNTDCAFVGYDAVAKTVWAGLNHLEGKLVDIVADNAALTPLTVTAGQVTLPVAANNVEIGLHYDSELQDLRPEVPSQDGTAQGRTSVSVNEITVRLENSRGCVINGETVPDTGTPFRGDKKVSNLGWGGESGRVQVKQTKPLPFTVLAIIKRVTVND